MTKISLVLFFTSLLVFTSYGSTTASISLFHNSANIPNSVMISVGLDSPLDSLDINAVFDLVSVTGLTVFSSGTFGECLASPGNTIPNILQAHMYAMVRVPCFYEASRIVVHLSDISLLNNENIQIVIKDLKFTDKKNYLIPIQITKDYIATGPIATVTAQITDDTLSSSDLASISFHLSGFYLNLSNLTTVSPDLSDSKFYLELKNFESVKSASNITNYLSTLSSVYQDMEINLSGLDFRSTDFSATADSQPTNQLWLSFQINNLTSLTNLFGKRLYVGLKNGTSSYVTNAGATLWVYSNSQQKFIYCDNNIELLGYYTGLQATAVVNETTHYALTWYLNITVNETIYNWQRPIINVNFTNATHSCNDSQLYHDCFFSPHVLPPYKASFKAISQNEVEISGLPTLTYSQPYLIYFNMSYNVSNTTNMLAVKTYFYVAPTGTKTSIANVTATNVFNRTIHGFTRFILPSPFTFGQPVIVSNTPGKYNISFVMNCVNNNYQQVGDVAEFFLGMSIPLNITVSQFRLWCNVPGIDNSIILTNVTVVPSNRQVIWVLDTIWPIMDYWFTFVNIEIPTEVFQSSEFKPYMTFNYKRKLFNTWDYSRTVRLNQPVVNKFPGEFTQTNAFETQNSIYTFNFPSAVSLTSKSMIALRFTSDYEAYLGKNYPSSIISNRTTNCSLNGNITATGYFYGPRELIVLTPDLGSVQNLTLSLFVKNPSYSATSAVSVIIMDDYSANKAFLYNASFKPSNGQIPKMTNTIEFQYMYAQLTESTSTNPCLTINFSTYNQTCTTNNPNTSNLNQTCLGDRAICLAGGNCTLNSNLDLAGSSSIDSLILNLTSKIDFSSKTKCFLNNQLISTVLTKEDIQGSNVLKTNLTVPLVKNTNHTLKCYDLYYEPTTVDNINVTLTLATNKTFVASSSRKVLASIPVASIAIDYDNNVQDYKNRLQVNATFNYIISQPSEWLLSLPSGYNVNSKTTCTGTTSSYSVICLASFTSNTQFKLKLPNIQKNDVLILTIDQIKNPSSIPSNTYITLQGSESSKNYNYSNSVLHPSLVDSFTNQSTRKLEYLYTVSTVNTDSTLNFTHSFTLPKNISGSQLQIFFPSSLTPSSNFKIAVYKGDSLAQITLTKVYENNGNLFVFLDSTMNGNDKITIKLDLVNGPTFTSADEIAVQIISDDKKYIQRFSSLAYPGVLSFPQGFGVLNSNGRAPIIITTDVSESVLMSSHSVQINFNGLNLNSPKCYLIKNVLNDDYYNIIDSVSFDSFNAVELNCIQSSNTLSFSNYALTTENQLRVNDLYGDLTAHTTLVEQGIKAAFVIISSSLELTGTTTFDLKVYHDTNLYDQKNSIPLQIQNQNTLTSLDHTLAATNLNNGERNSFTFSFTASAPQNYLSTAIFEPANDFIARVTLFDVEVISCTLSVNSVAFPVTCNYNNLDGNIYIQSFQLSSGTNNVVVTISNLRNYKDPSFNLGYTMRILEATFGSLIYQFNQDTATSSNFEKLFYKNNHLGVYDEAGALVNSIVQCKNTFGPELTIRDTNNLLINQRLLVTPRIWRVNYTPLFGLDVTDEFIVKLSSDYLEPSTHESKMSIAGLESGYYIVNLKIFNQLKLKGPNYVSTETFTLYIDDCLPTFTFISPESIIPDSSNVPIQILSSYSMPFDAKITVDYESSDSALVASLQESNPSSYSILAPTTSTSIPISFTGSSSSTLSYSINIYIGRNQDILAGTLTVPLTIASYDDTPLTINEFDVTSITSDGVCFLAQMNKVGRVKFIIANYPVASSLTLFNDVGYQNTTLYLEGDVEDWTKTIDSREMSFFQHESWSYSGVKRERISGKLLIPSAGVNYSICVNGLDPEEYYNIYYLGLDVQDSNATIDVLTFQTQSLPNPQATFSVRFDTSVSIDELNSDIIPVISKHLSFNESWLKIDGDMIFELGSSFPDESINEFISNPLSRSNNQYEFSLTLPKLLSIGDTTSAINVLKMKFDYLNTILPIDAQFISSFDPVTTITLQTKPARSTLKLELLADPFRGYSGDIVFPVYVENVHKLHVFVLKLSSFESYNMAYNNVPLSSAEIAEKSFLVDNTVNYRFTYNLATSKLESIVEQKDSYIDFDIDFATGGVNSIDYSQYRDAEIDGKAVHYVAIPFNDAAAYRVYITGEYLLDNEIYPETSPDLPLEIRNSAELAELLLEEIDNWKILVDDSSILAQDIKSTDAGIIAEIPNFLSVLDGERMALKVIGMFIVLCAFILF